MSNLSDIGFHAKGDEQINNMIISVLDQTTELKCPGGFYLQFTDPSGAELYLQGNAQHEMIGFNPHFDGVTTLKVTLNKAVEREASELDGAFHATAGTDKEYPFVFDVPDFRTIGTDSLPVLAEIQLTAFGSNDFRFFDNEEDFLREFGRGLNLSPSSFIARDLPFLEADSEGMNLAEVRPVALVSGTVIECERRTNNLTTNDFYWMRLAIPGGEADVVIDPVYVPVEPKPGQIAAGHFWLSGRIR